MDFGVADVEPGRGQPRFGLHHLLARRENLGLSHFDRQLGRFDLLRGLESAVEQLALALELLSSD